MIADDQLRFLTFETEILWECAKHRILANDIITPQLGTTHHTHVRKEHTMVTDDNLARHTHIRVDRHMITDDDISCNEDKGADGHIITHFHLRPDNRTITYFICHIERNLNVLFLKRGQNQQPEPQPAH